MTRDPGLDDWVMGTVASPLEGEVARRWNVAPDRQMPTAEAYQLGGLAGMENYEFGVPHEVFGGYDKAQAQREKDEASLAKAQSRSLSANPFANWSDPTPMVAVTPQGRTQDRKDINTIGGLVFPHSPLDVALSFTPLRFAKGALYGAAAALSGHDKAEAGMTPQQARAFRKARAQRMGSTVEGTVDEINPRAVLGGNLPPPEYRISPEVSVTVANAPMSELAATVPSLPAMTPKQAEQAWLRGLPRSSPANRSTELPDIRGLPVDQATAIARSQPHLIRSGERGEGLYVGGPRELQSKAALNKIRRDFDAIIAHDPRGADWYDRYRAGLNRVTGGDPVANEWASKQHGQWSAGVDPGSELHFVLKENNAAIAGMPVKAARPAQHEAHQAALAARDPNLYQLGEKTGEYATQVNPDQLLPPGATGVNDFRHARSFRYTEPGGEPQKGALGAAGHRFLDYETALAVDRANQANLGGRSDWTGEKLQAAPWVVQKAKDLMSRNAALSYEDAMQRALRTIEDYFPRHTYFATHEAQPGANVGQHMMGSIAAPQSVREEFALDPRSSWATAPGQRDAIYSGLGVEGTGNYMRVEPSQPMRGLYVRPDGTVETNPGEVARPLGTFNTARTYDKEFVGPRLDEPFKTVTAHDRAILNAGEALRGYLDAQNASAWHKLWFGGPAKESTSLYFPRPGPASEQELLALRGAVAKHGMGDVVDTGQGITATQFYEGPPPGGKGFERALRKGEFNQFGVPVRARVDSDYIDYVPKWEAGMGSGAATRQMLEYVGKTPELRDAFNRNAFIPERALARMERDKDWTARWGAPRSDIQNAREIIGQGPGWVDRIEAALKAGAILPATVAAIFAASSAARQEADHAQQ